MKLRQVRFAARVHFLDACINVHQRDHVHGCWPNSRPNQGQTMVNGKLCAMLFLSRLAPAW